MTSYAKSNIRKCFKHEVKERLAISQLKAAKLKNIYLLFIIQNRYKTGWFLPSKENKARKTGGNFNVAVS